MSLIQTQSVTIKRGGKIVCRNLNWSIEQGQRWGVLGPNGVGKTTLLLTLLGLHRFTGSVFVDGKSIRQLSRRAIAQKAGMLLQNPDHPFPATVYETVLTGRYPYTPAWGTESELDYRLTEKALQAADLTAFRERMTDSLSGGEAQRLGLATLLCQSPKTFLLDEPINHLDLHHQHKLLQQVFNQADINQGAVVMVLHDLNLAQKYCTHCLLLFDDGTFQLGSSHQLLTAAHLSALYKHPIRLQSKLSPL